MHTGTVPRVLHQVTAGETLPSSFPASILSSCLSFGVIIAANGFAQQVAKFWVIQ